jgi:hypothetical protein
MYRSGLMKIISKLTLTSPTSGGRSVGIVRSRTQATALSFLYIRRLKAVAVTSVVDNLSDVEFRSFFFLLLYFYFLKTEIFSVIIWVMDETVDFVL